MCQSNELERDNWGTAKIMRAMAHSGLLRIATGSVAPKVWETLI